MEAHFTYMIQHLIQNSNLGTGSKITIMQMLTRLTNENTK